MRLVSSVTWL
ncbi:Protein of unknown function [Propionibacterium freudenreichii]|nr:Protein of unknown function [Propionibacterium freudenreichii subsp. freudenreichii]CEG88142.1 Protein of unknown function [Propionibacterium freudenreichii]CEG94855.1 Protein of unknown function [Propionibacterium freudenreichii]CEH01833.1 Protein of unknown function [Propionibacterium freudenreichii]CEH05806.1 Protein of unknown function [Propionibacterium freudenreichii]